MQPPGGNFEASINTVAGTSFAKDVSTRKVDMTPAAEGVIECTYTNTQRGHLKTTRSPTRAAACRRSTSR